MEIKMDSKLIDTLIFLHWNICKQRKKENVCVECVLNQLDCIVNQLDCKSLSLNKYIFLYAAHIDDERQHWTNKNCLIQINFY